MQGETMTEAVPQALCVGTTVGATVTANKPPRAKKSHRTKVPNGVKSKSPNGIRKKDILERYQEESDRENSSSKRFDETAYMKWLIPLGSETKDYWSEYQSKYGKLGNGGTEIQSATSSLARASVSQKKDQLKQTTADSRPKKISDRHSLDYSSLYQDAKSSERDHKHEIHKHSSYGDLQESLQSSTVRTQDFMSLDDNALLLRRTVDFSDLGSVTAPVLHKSNSFESNTQLLSKQLRAGNRTSTRRCRSDLGFLTASRDKMPHAPRTAALLSNPAFRKHLARSVGHNPDDLDLEDSVDRKFKQHLSCLNVKLQSGSEENNNNNDEDKRSTSNKLRCSTSDISLSRHLQLEADGDSGDDDDDVFGNKNDEHGQGSGLNMTFPLATNAPSKRHLSSGDLDSDLLPDSGDPVLSQSHSVERSCDLRRSIPSLDLDSLRNLEITDDKSLSTVPSSPNKFHIPSFGEFKRLRKFGQVPGGRRPLSMTFDFSSVDTIREEEDTPCSERGQIEVKTEEVKRSKSSSVPQPNGANSNSGADTKLGQHSSKSRCRKSKSAIVHVVNESDDLGKPSKESQRSRSRSKKTKETNSSPSSDEPVIDLTTWDFSVHMTSDQSAEVKVKPEVKVKGHTSRTNCDTQSTGDETKQYRAKKDNPENVPDLETVTDAVPIPKPRRKRRPGVTRMKEIPNLTVTMVATDNSADSKVAEPCEDTVRGDKSSRKGQTLLLSPNACVSASTSQHDQLDPTEEREKLLEERRRKCSGQASREEIISFLQTVKTRGLDTLHSSSASLLSLDSCGDDVTSEDGTCSSGAEVERVDSGVGSETTSQKKTQGPTCEDCERSLKDAGLADGTTLDDAIVCRRCASRRSERKDTIQEIVNTEISYGKDLKIIREEFYLPMKTAGLVNAEQLQTIFINMEELINISSHFTDQLQDALDIANEQRDEDFMTVHIGKLFLQASNMLLAFETYCVNQSAAPILLDQLEKEKELLRIFLHVSQTDNSVLRRMSLKSFLVVPVQRIMKYPLLLTRLYKLMPIHHEDREKIRKAQLKIEDILELINYKAKDSMALRMRRKFSSLRTSQKLPTAAGENIELNKVAIAALGWNCNDINFLRTGRLLYSQPSDHLWAKKSKTLKFQPVHLVLATLGKNSEEEAEPDDRLHFYKPDAGVKEAAVILVKEKAGKYQPVREPLYLSKCVVAVDPDCAELFEVLDITKDSFLFKGEDLEETESWCRLLKLQAKDLGSWRRRRNAFANIMIQNMARS